MSYEFLKGKSDLIKEISNLQFKIEVLNLFLKEEKKNVEKLNEELDKYKEITKKQAEEIERLYKIKNQNKAYQWA